MFIDRGGPAFPCDEIRGPNGEGVCESAPGMSLRDYFAAQVMEHMISLSTDSDGGWSADNVANGCYNLADAMLRARSENRS